MTSNLIGITNEKEFYSDHYLLELFDGDVRKANAKLDPKDRNSADSDCNRGLQSDSPLKLIREMASKYANDVDSYCNSDGHEEQLTVFRKFSLSLLNALGYERRVEDILLPEGLILSCLHRSSRTDGSNFLWIVEAMAPASKDVSIDPLGLNLHKSNNEIDKSVSDFQLNQVEFQKVISELVFGLDKPPRFVLLISIGQAVLIDRNKWYGSKLLRFEFNEIFSRKESLTYSAIIALLHKEHLSPDSGISQIDEFDEASHRHAHGVSVDLKYALRESIEILGNEVVNQVVKKKKANHDAAYQKKNGENTLDPTQISAECLCFMYRLLFLFYIESRPELGFVPMNSEAYRKGYSIESLRELELKPLNTDEERNGYYFNESINLLFNLVAEGTSGKYTQFNKSQSVDKEFDMMPVKAELFDQKSTPLLSKIKFRNATLQKVIRQMSISSPDGNKQRGRISYAQLGINQLGAVYEGLLSYSGFFAQEDLYEVKKAKSTKNATTSKKNLLDVGYFVGKSRINDFSKEEIVYENNEPRLYPKGSFIYRLAGRDRESSASYYTPETLTRSLVKYSLKELLKDKTADEILNLTICEPAMGSAAFLVETVNQLTEAYLQKIQENGKKIPHTQYSEERQRVRALITDRNIFGVDRNDVARELGQVSLWLNCIHKDKKGAQFVPWFKDQLFTGNSLVGGRREVYEIDKLHRNTKNEDRWYNCAPRPLTPENPRKKDEVYHFLLPDPKMSSYKRSIVEPLEPECLKTFNKWRSDFCKPLTTEEIERLLHLSDILDALFLSNAKALDKERQESSNSISIFGQAHETERDSDYNAKNERYAKLRGEGVKNSNSYQRLEAAMNYWCSLWYWPIEECSLLPDRVEFYMELCLILEGNLFNSGADLFEQSEMSNYGKDEDSGLFDILKDVGFVDIEALRKKLPRLRLVSKIAKVHKFFHWPLELGDILILKGGFDLIVGNPPWIKLEWKDKNILSEFEPKIVTDSLSSQQIQNRKSDILNSNFRKRRYLEYYSENDLTISYLNATQNYSLIVGQSNLYKCFIEKIFHLLLPTGIAGIVHPDGHFTDPKGMSLRKAVYQRLIHHFQFRNELKKLMFSDVEAKTVFSLNVYRGFDSAINFKHISNLFVPKTIDECFSHDGNGPIPSIKNEDGDCQVEGHKNRVLHIDEEAIETYSLIMENVDFPDARMTRMPSPHSIKELNMLTKILRNNPKFGSSGIVYHMDRMWDETNDLTVTGIMRRCTEFHDNPKDMIIKGPNFFISNPIAKTPHEVWKHNSDFEYIDLFQIPDDYLPRANYTPNLDRKEYLSKLPNVRWCENTKHTSFFRCFFRAMTQSQNERTLICSIQPPDIAHPNSIESISFKDESQLINAVALWSSLPLDFMARSAECTHVWESFLVTLPWVELPPTARHRVLQLNCLTSWFSPLWDKHAHTFEWEDWSDDKLSLVTEGPKFATEKWSRSCGLRADYTRRQALLELDVLVAISLGLEFDEFVQMYMVQFPTMQSYEKDTWYDQNGRVVFTNSQYLTGVGLDRKNWNEVKDKTEDVVEWTVLDNTTPNGSIERTIEYQAPFVLPDRMENYRIAWDYFYPKYSSYGQR